MPIQNTWEDTEETGGGLSTCISVFPRTVVLYETKFQLRNRTTFFWLRLLLPFFFYAIDGQTVYGVKLNVESTCELDKEFI